MKTKFKKKFYKDILRAFQELKGHYTFIIGAFNPKLWRKQEKERNEREDMLINCLLQQNLYLLNSFFQKREHGMYTWMSPDGNAKATLQRFHTGIDHRLTTEEFYRELYSCQEIQEEIRASACHSKVLNQGCTNCGFSNAKLNVHRE
ncbi:hypothetical protein HUJ05_013231 [Dendroctonus ponderosae]|nr:hypothetical protein HUJ05_010918 [Dendroctonus ponderosae]KAH0999146.1 hypothetical protein HUJ05_005815 [Dendroctonus ponderosae]KAH1015518.1 hypothetical protein HUJ05_013231 [Dendroctonus ponderosae]